jgi:membrane-associated phospholipid phosphatase
MFPCGHTMLAAAIYLLIHGKRHPGFKRATGLLCLAEMSTLILSRGHYSIDTAGGMLSLIVIGWLARYRERFQLEG